MEIQFSTNKIRTNKAGCVERLRPPLEFSTVPAISQFLGREDDLDHIWEIEHPQNFTMERVAMLRGFDER